MALSCSKKNIGIIKRNNFKHNGDFYCVNCLHSCSKEKKIESHKNVCENKDFCNSIMKYEYTKILELNQCQKSDKARFITYADLECIIKRIDGCINNPKNSSSANLENSSSAKVSEHSPSGFSMSTISSFSNIGNNHKVCRDKDCTKKFFEFLREHAIKITNLKKKKMTLLTKEQQKSKNA